MNTGFKKLTVSDPNKLKTFIEGTTGSIVAILNVGKQILSLNDSRVMLQVWRRCVLEKVVKDEDGFKDVIYMILNWSDLTFES